MTMQVVNTVEVKKHKIITMKVQRRKPDPGKAQTTESPEKQHIDKMVDVPVRLQRQLPNVQAVKKNRGDSSSCSSSTKLSTSP